MGLERYGTGLLELGKGILPSEPKRGGTFRIVRANYIGLMNPNHWPVYDWGTMELIHEKFRDCYVKPSIDKLVQKGRMETDMSKRHKIYWELEKIGYDDYADVLSIGQCG